MAATPVMECVVRVDVFVDIEVLHRDADAVLACIVSSRSRIGVVVTCMVGCCVAAPGNHVVVVVVIGCNDR